MILYILDDDRIELAMWADIIKRSGLDIEFELFSEGGVFKAAVFKKMPDACVIDFIMPFHPGTEVCKWVRDNHPEVRLYVNTSLVEDEYQVLSERLGATFLSKEKMTIEERLEVIANGCKS